MTQSEPSLKERIALFKEQIRLHTEISKTSFSIAQKNMLAIPTHPIVYPHHYEAIYDAIRVELGQSGISANLVDVYAELRPELMKFLVKENVFPSDYNLERWHSVVSETIRGECRRNPTLNHASASFRAPEAFETSPNAQFYSYVDKTIDTNSVHFCICAPKNTVMLCNNVSHVHCLGARRATFHQPHQTDDYRDRLVCGEFNQNIVACNILGPCGSNERWNTLIGLVCRSFAPVHGSELCNLFDLKLSREPKWQGPRSCLASFMYSSREEDILGKRGDRDFSLLPHTRDRLVRSREIAVYESKVHHAQYLDLFHPHHSRIDARNACALTLALVAFVDATDSTLWLELWELWCRLIRAHIRTKRCYHCKRAFSEGLSLVILCFAITEGGVSNSFFRRCEEFLMMVKILETE